MIVRVQAGPFDMAAEQARLTGGGDTGAIVGFTGLVRGAPGATLTIEHYAGMTERAIAEIAGEAARRWALQDATVIHRHGKLAAGEPIVLVLVAARHRKAAFEAAEFLIDWLKTRAPFWKKEAAADGSAQWVEARGEDDDAAARWG